MPKVEHISDARVLLGIDISKHRHEVLIAAPGKTRRRRLTLTNSTDDFMRMIAIMREYGPPVRIGFEATGNYHSVLMYHLGVAGFDLNLVSSVALARARESTTQPSGLADLAVFCDDPEGIVRITTFPWIAQTFLARRLPAFLAAHPGITVQVTVDDKLQDIVADGFDAGLRFGEDVEKDMIAVRVGSPLRHLVVATPQYWERHGRPTHPRDRRDHPCVVYHRLSSGSIAPWESEQSGRKLRLRMAKPPFSNSQHSRDKSVQPNGDV